MTDPNTPKPVKIESYSTFGALEVIAGYHNIRGVYDKALFMKQCTGVKLVIDQSTYYYEYFGKALTPKHFLPTYSTLKERLKSIFQD